MISRNFVITVAIILGLVLLAGQFGYGMGLI